MGMLGALSGAGKGLQSYSKTLGEKRKLDWSANQQELTAQRNINLENIRAGNARKLQGEQQSFMAGESKLNRAETGRLTEAQQAHTMALQEGRIESAESMQDKEIFSTESMKAATLNLQKRIAKETNDVKREALTQELGIWNKRIEAVSTLSAQESEQAIKEQAAKYEGALDMFAEQAKMTAKFSKDERNEKADALQTGFMEDGIISPIEQLTILGVRTGTDLKGLLKTKKAPTAEMLKNLDAVLLTDEVYINGTAAKKIAMIQDAFGKLSGQSGSGVLTQAEGDVERIVAMSPDAQKAFMDNLQSKDPAMYRKVSQQVAKASQSTPGGTRVSRDTGPGMFQGIKDFTQRNVKGGLNDFKRSNPQRNTETKLAYEHRMQKEYKEAQPKQLFTP